MDACVFCKISAGEIPAKVVHRDEVVVAIEDLNPQAPTHLLVMPAKHYGTIVDVSRAGDGLLGLIMEVAANLGRARGGAGGFRVVVNTGADGGQTVNHAHVHVLAGRPMSWPPG